MFQSDAVNRSICHSKLVQMRHLGGGYTEMLRTLREIPGCVGYHLCGAYLRNDVRKRALRDAAERPDDEALAAITAANRETAAWMRAAG